MTVLDERIPEQILTIVGIYGKEVKYIVESNSFDAVQGQSSQSSTSYKVKVTPPANYSSRYVDGNLIRRDDVRVYLPAKGLKFTPALGHKVEFDGFLYSVLNIGKIYVGETIGIYDLQLRD